FLKLRTRVTRGEPALIDLCDLGDLITCEEVLIDRSYDLSQVPFEPDLIVDCGAHIGLFSLIAGLRYPTAQILAYEPNPRNCHMTQKQLARFGDRAKVIEAAVDTTNGRDLFGGTESNVGRLGGQAEATYAVETIDLAQRLSRWNAKHLLLKMDIEGSEHRVL